MMPPDEESVWVTALINGIFIVIGLSVAFMYILHKVGEM